MWKNSTYDLHKLLYGELTMTEIKKQIYEIQELLRDLNSKLTAKNIYVESFLQEMIEALAFINGYSDKSLENEKN